MASGKGSKLFEKRNKSTNPTIISAIPVDRRSLDMITTHDTKTDIRYLHFYTILKNKNDDEMNESCFIV